MEKTFEEMIEEKFDPKNYSGFQPSAMADKGIKDLMQQVREATIAETIQLAKEDLGIIADSRFIQNIKNLPTDRIILTDK